MEQDTLVKLEKDISWGSKIINRLFVILVIVLSGYGVVLGWYGTVLFDLKGSVSTNTADISNIQSDVSEIKGLLYKVLTEDKIVIVE